MLSKTVVDEAGKVRVVIEDAPRVATSFGPLGTVCGFQFSAVYQSPEMGFVDQVALPARRSLDTAIPPSTARMRRSLRGSSVGEVMAFATKSSQRMKGYSRSGLWP